MHYRTSNDAGHGKNIVEDTVGSTPLNKYGEHYWMLDVDINCSRAVDGWFEARSFISNGSGWDNDVSQPGAPWPSRRRCPVFPARGAGLRSVRGLS